jgi:hypothetical protein
MLTLESIMLYAVIALVILAPMTLTIAIIEQRRVMKQVKMLKRELRIRDTGSPHSSENAQRH